MKYAALQTGLKPYLIRSWESRYNAISPKRSENKRRCFTDDDIERLKLLKHAVDQGHQISSVARMNEKDLVRLLEKGASDSDHGKPESFMALDPSKETYADAKKTVEAALSLVTQLDAWSFEQLLSNAAVELPRQSFLQNVVMPLFKEIGGMWRTGNLKIINEHMASVITRSILWDMLRGAEISKEAPKIVVATPVGHWHEIGALASALAAAESGWRSCYFGPNLPSEEIAYAVKKIKASAVALSLCHLLNDGRTMPEILKLYRLIDSRKTIFIGGAGAEKFRTKIFYPNVIVGANLDEFRNNLDRLGSENII